jgi:hypothetical protein
MSLITSFTRTGKPVLPAFYETMRDGVGSSSLAMLANLAVGVRVSLPFGPLSVTSLGYICITATGSVELAILRPTVRGGLVTDLIATTGMVVAAGSAVVQTTALPSRRHASGRRHPGPQSVEYGHDSHRFVVRHGRGHRQPPRGEVVRAEPVERAGDPRANRELRAVHRGNLAMRKLIPDVSQRHRLREQDRVGP